MVLCSLNLNMRMGMATLICCITDSVTGKFGDSKEVLHVGDGFSNAFFPAMDVPCAIYGDF